MPLYTGEPTLLERDPRAWVRSCSRPTCLRRRFDKPRSRSFPLLSSPLPLSSSPAFVTARDIYPTRDIHIHTRVHAHTWRINIYVYGERRKEKNGRDISERRSVDRRNRSLRTELVPNRKEGGGGGGRWASIGGHVDGEEIVTAR